MSLKDSALLDVGYPIYAAKFVNNKTVLVTGGGGEGDNGIPNKITAVKCSFKVKEANRRLQKFREITLPANEDSPQCLDIAKIDDDKENKVSVFVGCNQSTQLIKSMNINNNLRKYVFNEEEHLRFIDAAQLEPEINSDDVEHYPKLIRLSAHNGVGCFMVSKTPSKLYIFDPETLVLKHKPVINGEIKDFHLSPSDDGKTLCFVTENTIETVDTSSGNFISTTQKVVSVSKLLTKYALSKVRFIDNNTVIIGAAVRDTKAAVLLKYSLAEQKILQVGTVSKSFKNIVAFDINLPQGLVAIAGNDLSVSIIKADNFKVLTTFKKLHPFAITTVAFSPNGLKLATGSAASSLLVFRLPKNYSGSKSTLGSVFQYLFSIILAVLLAAGLFKAHENGQLEQAFELTKEYGQVYGPLSYELALKYGTIGYEFVKSKINREGAPASDSKKDSTKDTSDYFTINPLDSEEVEIVGEHDTYIPNEYQQPETQTASTTSEATIVDEVEKSTINVDSITNDPEFNSETFFEDTANYVTEVVVDKHDKIVDAIKERSSEVNSSVEEAVTQESVVSVAASVASEVASSIVQEAAVTEEFVQEATPVSVVQEATSVIEPVQEVIEPVQEVIEPVQEVIEPVVEQVVSKAAPVVEQVVEKAAPVIEQVVEEAAPVASQVVEKAVPVVSQIVEEAAPVVSQIVEEAAPVVSQIANVIPVAEEVTHKAASVVSEITSTVESVVIEATSAVSSALEDEYEEVEVEVYEDENGDEYEEVEVDEDEDLGSDEYEVVEIEVDVGNEEQASPAEAEVEPKEIQEPTEADDISAPVPIAEEAVVAETPEAIQLDVPAVEPQAPSGEHTGQVQEPIVEDEQIVQPWHDPVPVPIVEELSPAAPEPIIEIETKSRVQEPEEEAEEADITEIVTETIIVTATETASEAPVRTSAPIKKTKKVMRKKVKSSTSSGKIPEHDEL